MIFLFSFIILYNYYYISLRSSIILYLSSGGINLSLTISFSFVSELLFGEVFWVFVAFLAVYFELNHQLLLLFIELLFSKEFKRICSRMFSMIKKFLTMSTTYVFAYGFTNIFTYISWESLKSIALTNTQSLDWTE